MSDTSLSSSLAGFIARQRVLLAEERLADLERSKLLLTNCPPKVLEQKGLALLGLGIVNVSVGLGGKTLIELDRPSAYHTNPIFPPHTLRTGDLASIEPHTTTSGPSAKDAKGIEGVVYKLSDSRIIVAVDNGDEVPDLPERCRVVKIANTVTYDRMDKAIDQLERILVGSGEISSTASTTSTTNTDEHLTPLLRVLYGLQPPSRLDTTIKDIQFFDSTLNESQKEAVKFCLAAKEVACIHGPPGTGKTHTLVEIIRQLACSPPQSSTSEPSARNRILVAGASNLSVDNILERLLPYEDLTCTRIGHPARVLTSEKGGTAILETTLDARASRSDQAELVKDVKKELEGLLGLLSSGGSKKKAGSSAGGRAGGGRDKGTARPRGAERKKMWEEVKALRKEYRQRESQVTRTILSPSSSQIVFATCHSAGSRQLQKEEFDVVIIDEATQALEAVTLIPIFQAGFKRATKLILAGDPMQLPPTVLADGVKKKDREKRALKEKKRPEKKRSKNTVPAVGDSNEDEDEDEDDESEEEQQKITNQKETSKGKEKAGTGVLRPPRTLEMTLFDRLEEMWGPGIKRMLDVQYRMHAQICTFPSLALYANKLISHSSVASHLLSDLPDVKKEEDLSIPVIFYDTAGCEYYEKVEGISEGLDGGKKKGQLKIDPEEGGSRWNENEALVVKSWVEDLISNGIKPTQVAIITPYQAQVAHISALLHPTHPEIEIGSVDGMQGREKEAVIISLVRSNSTREVGFLKEKRRLNVAMTRAKRSLCIVGDSSTISHGGKYLKKWMKWLDDNADIRYAGLDGLEQ